MEDHIYYEGMKELEELTIKELQQKAYDEHMQKGVVTCNKEDVSTQRDFNLKDGRSNTGGTGIPKYRKRKSRK